jgi:hypothetical protein
MPLSILSWAKGVTDGRSKPANPDPFVTRHPPSNFGMIIDKRKGAFAAKATQSPTFNEGQVIVHF